MTVPAKPLCIHIHGVSVGEVLSAVPVVQGLLAALPGCTILATSWTKSSQALLRSIYGQNPRVAIDRLPFDTFWNHATFYKRHRIDAALWIDSEIWPGWLVAMKKRRIPAALINGRMSERSARRWAMLKPVIRHILGLFDRIDAQSRQDADHFRSLGAKDVSVQPVNMKYMRPALAIDAAALSVLKTALGDRPSIAFLSTHPGDETRAFTVHKTLKTRHPDLLTVIVPRHIDRVPDLMAEAVTAGLTAAKRSDPATHTPSCDILFGDTIGDMGLYIGLSPIVIMGKSFDPAHKGGQSPIEAAQLGRALVCGPYMTNFPGIMDDFKAADAIRAVDNDAALIDTLTQWLAHPQDTAAIGQRAQSLCRAKHEAGPAYLATLSAYIARVTA